MKEAVCDPDHIEASLRIFKPDLDLEEIAPRVVPPPHAAFKGEVSRVILDTLRKTTRPLSTRDVTFALMRHRGLRTDNAKLVRLMQQRTGACLAHWRRRGYLRSTPGTGDMLNWEIAERQ
jgi:hypothetical protein